MGARAPNMRPAKVTAIASEAIIAEGLGGVVVVCSDD